MYYAIPEGSNYAVYSSNGTRVSTTSAAGLSAFGLSTSNLGSKPSTSTSTITQTTTQPATPTQTTQTNVNAGRTQVTLGNGQVVWYDSAGQAYDASGAPVSNTTVSQSTAGDSAPGIIPVPAGYNLAGAAYVKINGKLYQVNGNGTLSPSNQGGAFASNAQDISAYAPQPSTTTEAPSTTSSTPTTTTSTQTANPLAWDAKYGVDQNTWNQLSDTQKAVVLGAYTAKQQAYENNAQQLTFDQALQQAAQDPNIVSTFADAAKVDKAAFQQGLLQLQQATSVSAQQQQQQFENERKQLAEQHANAGTAYSGFRGQAQQQLGQQEAGIVTSSRAALQKQLDDATRAFEAKYGTGATTPASLQYQNPDLSSNYTLSGLYKPQGTSLNTLQGSTIGSITGSQPVEKQNAINAKAVDIYNLANFTPTVQ